MSKRLADKVAWVTGSSRGIGRAAAEQLAAALRAAERNAEDDIP